MSESFRSSVFTALSLAVFSTLLVLAGCVAVFLNGCGDLDGGCSCKCQAPLVVACQINGPGTCSCVMPYHKPVTTGPDGGPG